MKIALLNIIIFFLSVINFSCMLIGDDINIPEDVNLDPNAPVGQCPGFALITYDSPRNQSEYDAQMAAPGVNTAQWTAVFEISNWIEKPVGLDQIKDQKHVQLTRYAHDLEVSIKNFIGTSLLVVVNITEGKLSVEREYAIDSSRLMQISTRELNGVPDVMRLRTAHKNHSRILLFDEIAKSTATPSIYLIADSEYLVTSPFPDSEEALYLKGILSLYNNPHTTQDVRLPLYPLIDRCKIDDDEPSHERKIMIYDGIFPHILETTKGNGMSLDESTSLLYELKSLINDMKKVPNATKRLHECNDSLTKLVKSFSSNINNSDQRILSIISDMQVMINDVKIK